MKSIIRHQLIILVFTIISLFISGYRFGDGDQNSHIPFLLKEVDPHLYPGDNFVELRYYHYSFFWNFFVPILRSNLISIELLFFIVYFFSLYVLYSSFYELILICCDDRRASYAALTSFLIPLFSFTIFPTHETYLVNRVFVMPFLIFSLVLYLKDHRMAAFGLVGIMYNLHVITASFALIMMGASLLSEWKILGTRKMLLTGLSFLALALPVLAWKFNVSPLDLSINSHWFSLISRGALGHIFHLFSFNPPTIILSILGMANIFVFLWTYRQRKRTGRINSLDRKLLFFILVILGVLVLSFITGEFYAVTALVQLQLSRIGVFVPILTYPYFFAYVYKRMRVKAISAIDFGLILILMPTSGSLGIPWLYYLAASYSKTLLQKSILLVGILWGILEFFSVSRSGEWKPGIYTSIQNSPWYEVQMWARNNTKVDDVFITPVDKWAHYSPDFRLGSQRSTVVTLGDLMELAFHPRFINIWEERFEDVVPGAIAEFRGNFIENKALVKLRYANNSTERFMDLAKKYHASYIVVEKPTMLEANLVYENGEYRVYQPDR